MYEVCKVGYTAIIVAGDFGNDGKKSGLANKCYNILKTFIYRLIFLRALPFVYSFAPSGRGVCGEGDSLTQGVGFADVFCGMTKSKQAWPLCMP